MIKIVSTNHYGTLNATSACAAFLRDSVSKDPQITLGGGDVFVT